MEVIQEHPAVVVAPNGDLGSKSGTEVKQPLFLTRNVLL